MPKLDRSELDAAIALDAVKAISTGERVDGPVLPCRAGKEPPFPDKFEKPYKPKYFDIQRGWGLKDNRWMNVQQQNHGNCAVQTAQLLIRFGELRFGKNNTSGYSEAEMEILANCPNSSGYSRYSGTTPEGSLQIYKNAGMITCHHLPTPENIAKAVKAGFPVSTGHEVKHLWGMSSGGHRVATVGYLKAKGTIAAYLVHDTGVGRLYYVPAQRYKDSLVPGDVIIVIGKRMNCKDAAGNAKKPGACCLSRYADRKYKLPATKAARGKWWLDTQEYKDLIKEEERIRVIKDRFEYAFQKQNKAERAGDPVSAKSWKKFGEKVEEQWEADHKRWQKASNDLRDKITPTPMGDNDPDSAKDRGHCGQVDHDLKCDEKPQPCPICPSK